MNAENCCVEVSGKGVGLCMLVVVPLPAQLGKGNGLGWGRTGALRGALRELAHSRAKTWQLKH